MPIHDQAAELREKYEREAADELLGEGIEERCFDKEQQRAGPLHGVSLRKHETGLPERLPGYPGIRVERGKL